MKNCYIHIPFCKKICSYCDFCKMFYNEEIVNKYLNSLEKEIDLIYRNEELETIYLGGGTPGCLTINELEKLFKIISKLKRSKEYEFTIECNFESTTYEKLDLYKKNGINRISFGLESINNNNLELLERKSNLKHIESIINYCKKIGLSNINIDLMYALPDEDMSVLNKDIDYILSLDIPHISTYSLIIEEHTKLGIKNIKNIDEDLDSLMYDVICKRLRDNNYIHYEISNFGKEKYFSKHNLCYWNNSHYYGFGLGAASYIDNKRITNTRSINKYLNNTFRYSEELVTRDEEIEYQIILNLRKKEGINLEEFYNKFNINFRDLFNIDNLLDNNFLEINKNYLYIPEDKWYISNEIMVKILEGEVNE